MGLQQAPLDRRLHVCYYRCGKRSPKLFCFRAISQLNIGCGSKSRAYATKQTASAALARTGK